MEMTPAKLAFIKGQGDPGQPADPDEDQGAKSDPVQTIEVEPSQPKSDAAREPRARAPRRSTRDRLSHDSPEASDVLDQVLVPVTIRLTHRTAQALRRAHLELRVKHAKPDTQQKMVEEALLDWLSKHDFLE
jgi:hypothetical protein